ncbi:MAG: hypothetical protein KJO69_10875 [Gammaproteobacteria bacterium]|nr:hypothetical protein [Gammaproteobacteria bacterium]
MGITKQDKYNIGAADLLSPSNATEFLHGHLKLDEGGGDVLNDSSGNNRDLTWSTSGANATAAAAGVWTGNGLEYGSGTAAEDCFIASSKDHYNIGDNSKTWLAVIQYTLTSIPIADISLFSGRGAVGGAVDAGHTIAVTPTQVATAVHNGTSVIATITTGGTMGAANERFTAAIAVDASQGSFGEINLITCGDTTTAHIQYQVRTPVTITALNDTTTSNDFTCIGQRSSVLGANLTKDIIFHSVRCYCDESGGALPDNLGDIVRWLHQNEEANIPALWWN